MIDADRARKALEELIAGVKKKHEKDTDKVELSERDKLKQSLKSGFYNKYKKYGL